MCRERAALAASPQAREALAAADTCDILSAGFRKVGPRTSRPARDADPLAAAHVSTAGVCGVDSFSDELRHRATRRAGTAFQDTPLVVAQIDLRPPHDVYTIH